MSNKELREKFFKIWPHERNLVVRTQLDTLAPLVRNLELVSPEGKRAIRCRLPKLLKDALKQASDTTGKSMTELLVMAARKYRETHPVEPDWEPPTDGELFEHEDRRLTQMVFNLEPDDRNLIQNLGRGVTGVIRRRDAFEAMIPIVQLLEQELREGREQRVSVRVRVPAELDDEITRKISRDHKYVQILLTACRQAENLRSE